MKTKHKYPEPFDPKKYEAYAITKARVALMPYVLFVGLLAVILNLVSGFAVIILVGFGVLRLPDVILKIVATSTFGSVATAASLIFKFFFKKK